jgi:thymidine kinase
MSINEFIMFVGPMFGGKTTRLLSALERFKYQGKKIYTFKPSIDERYSCNNIVSHWGALIASTQIFNAHEISDLITSKNESLIIAIDEAFMIEGISQVLINAYHAGHTILVSSLQLSSNGSPYREIEKMLPHATKVEVCPAVCAFDGCESNAYFTLKIGGRDDHEIEVGGEDMYQPRCLVHFKV